MVDPLTSSPTDHRCRRAGRCCEADRIEQRPAVCAPCQCHNGPHLPCSVPGGCGHLHKPVPTKTGARIAAARGLCLTCERVTTAAITELPRDYVELHLALERGGPGLREMVAATKDLPAALRVNVAALAAELVRVATMWAEPVADRLGINWDSQDMDRHTRPGHALQRATNILSKGMSVLLAIRDYEVQAWADNGWYHTHEPADGLDGALLLLRLHEVTRAALGLTRLTHQLPAPCPSCDHLALVRHDGEEDVHCQHCHRRWTYTDYERLVLVLASDAKRTA